MASAASGQLLEDARASYESGDYHRCRALAVAGLADRPDDPALLRLAGKAGLELGLDDATGYLERATTIDSSDAETWHDLGDALAYDGRLEGAIAAYRQALALRPEDVPGLIDLGHACVAAGRTEEAIGFFRQAVQQEPGNLGALRGLADAYRRKGRFEEALAAARQVADGRPTDVGAALEVADLSLTLGRLDEASAAFAHVRDLDEDPEHEMYAHHGLIETEIRRDAWRRALDLAVDATRFDRLGRTTDVLAFVVAQVFGGSEDRPTPSRAEVEDALARSRAEHRHLHADTLVG